jgi:NAD(P)-dependent dehydrogenase (short-subunit alcohol dehydrogenase family)
MTVNDIIDSATAEERFASAEINSESVVYVRGDLTKSDDVTRLVQTARDRNGPMHIALCHVGMAGNSPLLEVTEQDWDRMMAVNTKTAFLLGQAASRSMIEDNIAGHLIFTVSWVADVPWPDIGPYRASKAAMKELARSFARELADKGIRANAMAPGIVGAGMAKVQWDTDPSYQARAKKAIPLGTLQTVDSVADAFLFLCSPAADYMTGSVLLVDGGCSLYPMD